jgi:regulator of sigma E protease
MIGFDIGGWKLSHKWGETEYGIGILPLGGYVKMLGQEDDPAHVAEQMQQSQVGAENPDAVPIKGPDGETYYVDRRSYLAKSVPQRMAIISAGVIMNVIFAFIFAVIAYGMGVTYMPCIVSEAIPGSPAWRAGIGPGDEIVQIGDRKNPTFAQLRGGVSLGDLENGIPCVVRQASDGKDVDITLTPEQSTGLAKIGIAPPFSLTLSDTMPAFDGSPAARAKLVEPPSAGDAGDSSGFQGGDRIVRVNDVDVKDYRDLVAELALHPGESLRVTVERKESKKSDKADAKESVLELTFEVAARPAQRFGLVLKMGPIAAIQVGSPAAKAGLKAGDVIEAVDGQPMATAPGANTWDAYSLPEYLRHAADEGRDVELTVARTAPGSKNPDRVAITLQPRVPTDFPSVLPPDTPMAAPAAGFAYRMENSVVAVWPGSPAATAGIMPGDETTSVQVTLPEDSPAMLPEDTLELANDKSNWPPLMDVVQQAPGGTRFELTVERAGTSHKMALEPTMVEGQFVPERGFVLKPIERIRKADSLGEQLRLGWDETADALTMVFRFLKKIGTQVPVTALGGPVTIAKAAGYSASEGLAMLLVFLTMLSANLAVINFLPIPLLDGGHMVFLAWEGIRGRPASEKFVVALHTAGFVLIISLMLFVIALDFGLIPRNL